MTTTSTPTTVDVAVEPGRPGSIYSDGPVWRAFGLSRAAYHVLPRRTLQSMPVEWQERYVALIAEARALLPSEAFPAYQVTRLNDGMFARDPNRQYRRLPPFPLCPAGAALDGTTAPLAGAFVNTEIQFEQARQ